MNIYTIPDGYSCCGGVTELGWYAGVYCLEDRDREFTEDVDGTDRKVRLLPGKSFEAWEDTMVDIPRRLVLVDGLSGTPQSTVITEAERVYGPACTSEKTAEPLLVWTESKNGRWRLMLRRGGATTSVGESSSILRAPAVAISDSDTFIACETELNGNTGIAVISGNGDTLLEIAGRRPDIAWSDGSLFLVSEVASDRGRIDIRLTEILADVPPRHISLRADDLNMFGKLAVDRGTGTVYICWESTPSWGYDPYTGRHRDINLWTCRAGQRPAPAAGTFHGKLVVPRDAYVDIHDSNMPPIRPQVVIHNEQPQVYYRRFRYRGNRCFG